jgi:hypothetical protein
VGSGCCMAPVCGRVAESWGGDGWSTKQVALRVKHCNSSCTQTAARSMRALQLNLWQHSFPFLPLGLHAKLVARRNELPIEVPPRDGHGALDHWFAEARKAMNSEGMQKGPSCSARNWAGDLCVNRTQLCFLKQRTWKRASSSLCGDLPATSTHTLRSSPRRRVIGCGAGH